MLKIIIATNNAHKVEELNAMLEGKVQLLSLKDAGITVDPDENGKTYSENAFIKAEAVTHFTSLPVMSDDSGIEIDELGKHFPGIYSHRFAMENGGQENLNKMLVKDHAHSKARFTCHIVLLNLNFEGERLDFEGIMEGSINSKVEGEHGFGYDPVFVPSGYKHSVATLPPEEKNVISHRYNAVKKLLNYLKENDKI
jgi:XTP/dITP diphosphohydrolase